MKKEKKIYHRFCNFCGTEYTANRTDSKWCSQTCKQQNYKEKKGLRKVIQEVKMDYPKLTFRLSVFGFIASIAFYLGVLHDLSEPKDKKDQKIEQLEVDNKQLKNHIELLENE